MPNNLVKKKVSVDLLEEEKDIVVEMLLNFKKLCTKFTEKVGLEGPDCKFH